jgi:hypothetical protein
VTTTAGTCRRTADPEFHHGGIPADEVFEVELSALRPAAINDKIYCPVDLNDPAVKEFAPEGDEDSTTVEFDAGGGAA